jgi:hypothetical protein
MVVGKKRIRKIEKRLTNIQERKESCVRRQRFEQAYELRAEENKLFAELEELTSAEHLKTKWKVINESGKYFSPKHLQ